MDRGTDPHEVLGITPTATRREIRTRFRALARRYHPDRNGGDPTAEWVFKQINEAHNRITDREAPKGTPTSPATSRRENASRRPWEGTPGNGRENTGATRRRGQVSRSQVAFDLTLAAVFGVAMGGLAALGAAVSGAGDYVGSAVNLSEEGAAASIGWTIGTIAAWRLTRVLARTR